jgi:hypothetical protein
VNVLKVLAVFITLVATSMTAVAAWDRGGTPIDKTILVAGAVIIVLAVHLLPSMSIFRRPIAWLVWTGCLLCAVYGHLTFLTHASIRAGEVLAQQSALAVGTQKQVETIKDALAGIKARPVAEVTAQLSTTDSSRVRAALRSEISEGKKAEALRDDLVRLSQVSTTAQIDGAVDPVTAKLAAFLGVTEGAVAVTVGLIFSMLMELIGALVWVEVLRPSNANSVAVIPVTARETVGVTRPVTQPESNDVTGVTGNETTHVTSSVTSFVTPVTFDETSHEADRVTTLKKAIELGKCKGTVAGIREYLGVSQSTAQELGRIIRSEPAI